MEQALIEADAVPHVEIATCKGGPLLLDFRLTMAFVREVEGQDGTRPRRYRRFETEASEQLPKERGIPGFWKSSPVSSEHFVMNQIGEPRDFGTGHRAIRCERRHDRLLNPIGTAPPVVEVLTIREFRVCSPDVLEELFSRQELICVENGDQSIQAELGNANFLRPSDTMNCRLGHPHVHLRGDIQVGQGSNEERHRWDVQSRSFNPANNAYLDSPGVQPEIADIKEIHESSDP